MSLPLIITFVSAIFVSALNLYEEYCRDLMMMQQNSYRNDRYQRWLRSSGDTTSYPRIVGMLVVLASLATWSSPIWGAVLIILFGAGSAITLAKRKYKKPLVWTPRVRRTFATMVILSLIITAAIAIWSASVCDTPEEALYYSAVALTALYCGSHIITMAAIWLLRPVEKSINRKYYNEAAEILRSVPGLKVIGITGSYGKTSTKHYLYRILSEQFETLMTPGSYNTTMGVIRTVREMMKPYCEVFICEMGAKQTGDIKEICDLVHPVAGIVTAVGPQHLESFKTIENVQRTKFELVDSLPADGLAVVNNDFPMVASRPVENVDCRRYGIGAENVEVKATDIEYGQRGTDFTVSGPGWSMKLHTRLVGECNVSNLLAAITIAKWLGVSDDKIKRAVERIEPVEHRLSMKRTAGGITILDDAFNSNPSGSAMALDVLKAMVPGKRIIITPGMIELGDRQYELNYEFGKKIATSADVAIVVGNYNHDAICEGIRSVEGSQIKLQEAATFADAQQQLAAIVTPGDTVLYENDLPDTFK